MISTLCQVLFSLSPHRQRGVQEPEQNQNKSFHPLCTTGKLMILDLINPTPQSLNTGTDSFILMTVVSRRGHGDGSRYHCCSGCGWGASDQQTTLISSYQATKMSQLWSPSSLQTNPFPTKAATSNFNPISMNRSLRQLLSLSTQERIALFL
jgi:hypothetical protein